MKVLVIDNYDSFTFNLVQLIGKFTSDIVVKRNDKVGLQQISDMNPDKILISPGPGRPEHSNISIDAIKEFGDHKPILGVCLGHQGIGICFGAKIINAPILMHGKTSKVIHDGKQIYKGIEQNFNAGRYHSLVIDKNSIQGDLEITSSTSDDIVMGVRHRTFPIEGIQFHPESVLTPDGEKLIKNWIEQ
ncbi:MAG: aminodeoxychorismate/anthranilate synthase component II [Melioribacteraceae bacterium]|nr:aminodeoxychorismate/anthranilate synthase component II [Melioribacteraceae bacterium]